MRRLKLPGGAVERVAGHGNPVYGGDGGSPIDAFLSPDGISIAGDGTLFLADGPGSHVREILP